jgi:tape measure domain-containing protein
MATLGELFVKVGADVEGFRKSMQDVNDNLKDLDKETKKSTAGIAAMGTQLQSVGMGMTAAITAPIIGFGLAVATVAGQMEQNSVAFETLLGSAQKAGKFLEELKQFAASTPFEFPDLVAASKKLLAMGFAAEEVQPMLRTIGDAVSALGGGSAEIDRVTLALGQMSAKGKVSAQEMNQLAELGIPAWQMLADKIGVDIPTAMKQAELGAISAATAVPALLASMDEKFGGSMAKQAQTLLGQWSNFKDQITLALMEVGTVLLPIMKDLLLQVTPLIAGIKWLAEEFGKLPTPVQNVLLGAVALAAALGPLVLVVGTLMTSFAACAPLIAAISGALSPLLIAVGAIAAAFALWTLGEWAYTNLQPFKDLADAVWGVVSNLAGLITDTFVLAWDLLALAIGSAWEVGKSFLEWVSGLPIISTILAGIKDAATGAFSAITGAFTFLSDALKDARKLLRGYADEESADALKSSNKLKIGTDGLTLAYKDWERQSKNVTAATKLNINALDDSKDATKAAAKEAKLLNEQNELMEKSLRASRTEALKNDPAWRAMALAVKDVADRKQYLIENISRLKYEMDKGNTSLKATHDLLVSVEKATADFAATARGVPAQVIPAWVALQGEMARAASGVQKIDDAYKTLGVDSSAVLKKKREDAVAAYLAIKDSGTASAADIQKAYDAMVAVVTGKTKESADKSKGTWETFSKQVSTIITDLSKDLVQSLFEGNVSWAEKGKNALKAMGEAVMRAFVEPATAALTEFMTGILTDLIGGKGFGAVGDALDALGKKMKDVFAGAASSDTGGPPIPGGGGGGGGGGGTSGVAGWIGAISSAISAITDVIGLFQQARQENTLNAIEWNTRKSSLHLEHMLGKINLHLPGIDDLNRRVNEFLVEWRELRDSLLYAMQSKLDALINITSIGIYGAIEKTNELLDMRLPNAGAANSAGMTVVLKVDGRELARAMVNYLDDAGATI